MDVRPQFGSAVGNSFPVEATRLSDLRGVLGLSESLGFSGQAWRKLIADGTAVCAKDNFTIVGLYAANHLSLISEGEPLRQFRSALSVLCNRFRLAEEQIAFGTLALVAPGYVQSNLRAQMLRALLRNIGLRYQHLFTYCRKQNPAELGVLLREGWRCFQEEDETCYLILPVAKTLRRLASELVLNPPAPARSPHLPVSRLPIPSRF